MDVKRYGQPKLLLLGPLTIAFAMLGSCGGGSDGPAGSPTPTPSTIVMPTAVVTPQAQTVSSGAQLAVAVAISGVSSGMVTLTSGSYTSAVAAISGGQASFKVPAGVLAIGSDTLSATVQSGGATVATATAPVTVTAATAPTVTASSTALTVNGHPFAALPFADGLIVSVTGNGTAGSSTGLRVFAGSSPTALSFRCFQPISLPGANGTTTASGLTATPNGAGLVLAAENAGIALLSRAATQGNCSGNPVVLSQGSAASAQGSFDVAITPDGRYAFVGNEYGVAANDANGNPIRGNVGVVALTYDAAGVPSGGTLIGQISTGGAAIAGVTLSPDGKRLYVTSELVRAGANPAGTGNAILAHDGCAQQAGQPTTSFGLLSVIDVAKAEASPGAGAIIATVAAGCSPVRSVVTADSEVVWVAARGDNRVLAFSARTLESNPAKALLGYADSGGIAPVGLALFGGGRLLAVANSNRFASPPTVGNMAILQAIPVQPTLLKTVAASYFPRNISVAADDQTLFLTNYEGGIVQVVSTAQQ